MSFDDDAHELVAEHHDSREQPAQGATNTSQPAQRGQQGHDSAPKASGEKAQGGDQDEGKPRSKRPLIIIAGVVAVLAIAGFIAWFVTATRSRPTMPTPTAMR